MPKSPKKVSTKPKKAASKTTAAKSKNNKEPKMTFMMKVLKQREEQRKQTEPNHLHPMKSTPHTNDHKSNIHGFGRFAGPRRKAG